MEVKVSTLGRAGILKKSAMVETSDPGNAKVTLTVTANVVVDLDFERPSLRFPRVKLGEETVRTMAVLAKNPGALAFGEVKSTIEGLKVRMVKEEKEGAPAWNLEMRYKPAAIGHVSGTITADVLKPKQKILSLAVSALVEGDIRVIPTVLTLRRAPGSDQAEAQVTLKADTGTFDIKKIEEEQGYLAVKKEEVMAGKAYRLDVGLSTKGKAEENFSTKLVLKTSSAEQATIEVPVHMITTKAAAGGGATPSVKKIKPKITAVPLHETKKSQ